MSQMKNTVKGLKSVFLGIFLFVVAICCWLDRTWEIQNRKFNLGNVFVGCLLCLFTYAVVFKDYKKTLSKLRFIFALETLLFVFLSVTCFFLPGLSFKITYDQSFFNRFSDFNFCLALMFTVHAIIKLHMEYFKKETSFYLYFILYLFMLGFGAYALGSNLFNDSKTWILKTLAVLAGAQSFYLIFVGIFKIKNSKKTSSKKEN